MKLQQLRYFIAVVENGFNITAASDKLYTSQPGVSKQLKLLEEELDVGLFARNGKSLYGLTKAGQMLYEKSVVILREIDNIKEQAVELKRDNEGTLTIATTHTQARYVLPEVLQMFREKYPQVKLELYQGSSEQISDLMKRGDVDFAIASSSGEKKPNMVTLPCYHWDRALVLPVGHPLLGKEDIELADLAEYPLITYVQNDRQGSSLNQAFEEAGVEPNIAITARDADVIKEYVRKGLGVGIIASMAFDPYLDSDLVAVSTVDILPNCTTWIGFQEHTYLRNYMYEFSSLVASHLSRDAINQQVVAYRMGNKHGVIDERQLPYKLIARPAKVRNAA
jgi:LysR family transcriptional regulator, cys regulon transcriptional activator